MWASWGLVLARTDPEVPKHAGLTMFAIRMDDPAVEVRPLVQMNGDRHFSEVFVSGARVPDDWRIGELGAGWNVAVTVLTHERASAGGGGGGGERKGRGGPPQPPSWLRRLEPTGVLEDPVQRQRAMCAPTPPTRPARGPTAGPHRRARRGRPVRGRSCGARRSPRPGLLRAQHAGPGRDAGRRRGAGRVLTAPSMSIRGGTDEIQRNIVGERVSGCRPNPGSTTTRRGAARARACCELTPTGHTCVWSGRATTFRLISAGLCSGTPGPDAESAPAHTESAPIGNVARRNDSTIWYVRLDPQGHTVRYGHRRSAGRRPETHPSARTD